jgi:hypothetical protein
MKNKEEASRNNQTHQQDEYDEKERRTLNGGAANSSVLRVSFSVHMS